MCRYTPDRCNAYFNRQQLLGRIHLAILADGKPFGDIILKNVDRERDSCRLSIHLMDDSVKNKGYGTAAGKQAMAYAFSQENM